MVQSSDLSTVPGRVKSRAWAGELPTLPSHPWSILIMLAVVHWDLLRALS